MGERIREKKKNVCVDIKTVFNRTEKEGKILTLILLIINLEYAKQLMHSVIAHYPLTNVQPVPEEQPLASFPS